MKIWLIRHGETKGNSEKKYIGRTDEALNEKGIEQAKAFFPPKINKLIISPMLRCRQTAKIIFPDVDNTVCNELRECDFGLFEGKNADELKKVEAYRAWVDDGCIGDIPCGENVEAFKKRCYDAFQSALIDAEADETFAFVIHGGCIMAILERYEGKRGYYDYHIGNCEYSLCLSKKANPISLSIVGGILC
ncbi:MAG: histidine phosphatase family protein [Clostridia bacterium]